MDGDRGKKHRTESTPKTATSQTRETPQPANESYNGKILESARQSMEWEVQSELTHGETLRHMDNSSNAMPSARLSLMYTVLCSPTVHNHPGSVFVRCARIASLRALVVDVVNPGPVLLR